MFAFPPRNSIGYYISATSPACPTSGGNPQCGGAMTSRFLPGSYFTRIAGQGGYVRFYCQTGLTSGLASGRRGVAAPSQILCEQLPQR
eukprot:gene12283-12419_t